MPLLLIVLILLVTGLAMGAINSLAGAAGALGLVGLEEAAGLAGVAANASLRPSAVAIGLSGYIAYRSRGKRIPRRAWMYGLMTIPGALAGAMMALALPIWVYRSVLLAVLLTVLWQQFRPQRSGTATPPQRRWIAPVLFLWVGAHMGFIQVGTGLVTIAVLTAVHSDDLIEINAAKMATVLCASSSATAVLAFSGKIDWGPSLTLALGCGAGSFVAIRWSIDKGHQAIRTVVIAITTAVLARLLWQITTT